MASKDNIFVVLSLSGGNDGRVYWARLDGGEPRLLAKHEGALSGVSQLALTSDGRVVPGGRAGRGACARLDKGEPRLLAQHEGELFGGVSQLALTGDGRVVTGGNDGRVYCAQLDGGEQLLLAHQDRKSTRLNTRHEETSRLPCSG